MNIIKLSLIIISAFSVATTTEIDDSSLIEAKLEKLEALIREQQHANEVQETVMQNHQHVILEQHTIIQALQQRITEIGNDQGSNGQMFDCYRTGDWTTDGIITFNGCSVDTTTSKPWKGNFTIEHSGIYRFTFEGLVGIPDVTSDPIGFVKLLIDDTVVASGYMRDENGNSYVTRYFMVSLNTLQILNVGQRVNIQWDGNDGAYLRSNANSFVHFTGHNIASSTLVLPQCEYTGQTFEYPGSCRKYYLCLADGTIELDDCCPDVFDPVGEICVSEEDEGNLCNDVDTCYMTDVTSILF